MPTEKQFNDLMDKVDEMHDAFIEMRTLFKTLPCSNHASEIANLRNEQKEDGKKIAKIMGAAVILNIVATGIISYLIKHL